jgi:hypothetical protein
MSSYAVAVVFQQHQIDCFLIPAAHHPMSCISHSSLSSSHSHTTPPPPNTTSSSSPSAQCRCWSLLSSYAVVVRSLGLHRHRL